MDLEIKLSFDKADDGNKVEFVSRKIRELCEENEMSNRYESLKNIDPRSGFIDYTIERVIFSDQNNVDDIKKQRNKLNRQISTLKKANLN